MVTAKDPAAGDGVGAVLCALVMFGALELSASSGCSVGMNDRHRRDVGCHDLRGVFGEPGFAPVRPIAAEVARGWSVWFLWRERWSGSSSERNLFDGNGY
ncbi:hypothetical protein LQL77_30475 [Rhodococcus cerastii]|nr:hypothetical protein [Rhodococcus cerastii]